MDELALALRPGGWMYEQAKRRNEERLARNSAPGARTSSRVVAEVTDPAGPEPI